MNKKWTYYLGLSLVSIIWGANFGVSRYAMEIFDPADGRPIKKITFVVEGHDHLKFTSPKALIGLPQPFFDFNSLDELVNDIKARLEPKTAAPEPAEPRPRESTPGPQKGIALETLTTAMGKDANLCPCTMPSKCRLQRLLQIGSILKA